MHYGTAERQEPRDPDPGRICADEAAAMLRISERTLAKWERAFGCPGGDGAPDGSVTYSWAEVAELRWAIETELSVAAAARRVVSTGRGRLRQS